MENFYEFKKNLHLIFIDLKKAYNNINMDQLQLIFKYFGIPSNLVKSCKTKVLMKIQCVKYVIWVKCPKIFK